MRQEWISRSEYGMSYHVSDGGSKLTVPITWKDVDEFLASLEQASQDAFGMSMATAAKSKGSESSREFEKAWMAILLKKMRRG